MNLCFKMIRESGLQDVLGSLKNVIPKENVSWS